MGCLGVSVFLSSTQERTPDQPAAVNHLKMFRAVKGVTAEIPGQPVVLQFAERLFLILRLRQRHDSVQNNGGAVTQRAILTGPDQKAVTNKQSAGRPGPADIRNHRIQRMRRPRAQWALGEEKIELAVDVAVFFYA